MEPELETRIRRAQGGDREAFAQLLEAHYATMLRYACNYCGNRNDAEDVTQQACIKLARSIGQFRFESAFSTWLYRLVVNCALDWFRSRKGSRKESSEDGLAALAVESTAESIVMLHQVLKQVAAMGEGYRETLVLVMGEGLSHAEAASVLEIKESTVSWRLHEIRKRLRESAQPGVDV